MALLEVLKLRTYYYVVGDVRRAVDGVTLTVDRGEVLGIVGRSGSGKSVLARSILGLIREPGRIVDGKILFDNRNLLGMTEKELRKLRGQEIALIVPSPLVRLNPLLGAGWQIANVLRSKRHLSAKEAFQRATDLLASVEIADPARTAHMLPSELSGGMCQRVVIAMALANEPRLIVADEPTGGLDVTIQRQMLELMAKLVREHGVALLLMTRDLGVVAHFCQRVAVLKEGQVVETQPVLSFFKNPQHPHSKLLLRTAFAVHGEKREVVRQDHI